MWTPDELIEHIYRNYIFASEQNALSRVDFEDMCCDEAITRQFDVCCGASKIGLVSREGDFVCKFNYSVEVDNGYHDWYESDEEIEQTHIDGCIDFEEYNNYCDDELYYSEMFENAGFGDLIAKVKLGNVIPETHIQMYIQEKARIYHDWGSLEKASEDSQSKAKDIINDIYVDELEEEWLADLIEYCGEDRARDFLNYIDELGINDLHSGNVGYINDAAVLIDFSGYYD